MTPNIYQCENSKIATFLRFLIDFQFFMRFTAAFILTIINLSFFTLKNYYWWKVWNILVLTTLIHIVQLENMNIPEAFNKVSFNLT